VTEGSAVPLPVSDDRVRAALAELIDPVALLRPVHGDGGHEVDFEVVYVNGAADRWGTGVGDRWPGGRQTPDTRPTLAQYVALLRGGPPLVLETLPVPANPERTERVIDLRATATGGDILVTWRDTTDRVLAERALLATQTRFREIIDAQLDPGGIAEPVLDADGRVVDFTMTYVNSAAAAWGVLTGSSVRERGERSGDPALFERYVDVLRTGEPLTLDGVAMHAAGADRFMDVRVFRVGQVVYGSWRDVTAHHTAVQELARRALYDPLTGLANRALLTDHLAQGAKEAERDGTVLAVLYIDLDRFKDINDTLGHTAGDEVLRQVAARLVATVPGTDTAARLAGDEFVVATRVEHESDAARTAATIAAALSEPIGLAGRQLTVRPSIGITTTRSSAVAPEALLHQADLAMYHAKRGGPVPWALYDETLHRASLERLTVEEDLRTAIRDHHLRLVYQPIVDVTTGAITSVEALLRIEHPDGQVLAPAAFIDVAEASDLILPIGGWVLDEACRQLARWQAATPGLGVSVNVSARQVDHLVAFDQVLGATTAAGIDPHRVVLELTERVLLDADDAVVDQLERLHRYGCTLAIDDFGTGYSSLGYLKRFPVREVKIDRTFVDGLGRRAADTAIVGAIIGMARALDLTTVAEGVEDPDQLTHLRALGCDRAQGYLLGRPSPADAITRALELQGASD
jgi:diguanylate cyclase (GGDEF)-like protein